MSFGPGYGDVEPFDVVDEANATRSVGSDEGDEDDFPFAALEGVNCIDDQVLDLFVAEISAVVWEEHFFSILKYKNKLNQFYFSPI